MYAAKAASEGTTMNKSGSKAAEVDEVANMKAFNAILVPIVAGKVSRKKVNLAKLVISRNADAPILLTDCGMVKSVTLVTRSKA